MPKRLLQIDLVLLVHTALWIHIDHVGHDAFFLEYHRLFYGSQCIVACMLLYYDMINGSARFDNLAGSISF